MTLTVERLRELFSYDQDTGVFTRKVTLSWNALAGQRVGTVRPQGYVNFSINGKLYYAHRLAWLYATGAWPQHEIDHIDGDKSNNRISNLRDVQRTVNSENFRQATKRNKSTQLLGAFTHKRSGRFVAAIRVHGVKKHIGCFATAQEAHDAYVAAKRKLHEGNTL